MIDSVPEVPIESDQSPDAEQDVALAEDQEIVNESLTPIELVLKERETVGAGVGTLAGVGEFERDLAWELELELELELLELELERFGAGCCWLSLPSVLTDSACRC